MQSSSRIVVTSDGRKQLLSYNKTQRKIVRENVRSEEEYLEHLGKIIQRDFFPDLDAVKGGSVPASETPDGRTPALTTPSKTAECPPSRNPELDPIGMSLDKYLANNTTEDNASFIEIIEDADRRRGAKLSEFFPPIVPEALTNEPETLAISDGSSSSQPKSSVTTAPRSLESLTSHNTVHFLPDGAPPTAEELAEHFNRERKICPANSRFKRPLAPPPQDKKKLFGGAGSIKMGRIGIDGKERLADSPLATPQAGGYKFMDASPSPYSLAADGTPLITWGEVDSTPYRLDEATGRTPVISSGVSSFRIPSPSARETIAHQLADKAGRQRASGRIEAMKIAKSGLLSPHISKTTLSPAARRLLTSTGRLSFGGGGLNTRPNSGLRSSDLLSGTTPRSTPRRLPSDLGIVPRANSSLTKPPRLVDKVDAATVSTPGNETPSRSAPDASITNDLLRLPTSASRGGA
ncbi:DiGeorge syndrome critical region protein 14 [Sparganum proliferum]